MEQRYWTQATLNPVPPAQAVLSKHLATPPPLDHLLAMAPASSHWSYPTLPLHRAQWSLCPRVVTKQEHPGKKSCLFAEESASHWNN